MSRQISDVDTSQSNQVRFRMKSRASGAINVSLYGGQTPVAVHYDAYYPLIPYFILNNTSADMNIDEEIVKEIKIEVWKKSLDYSIEDSTSLLKSVLQDYDIELTDDNIMWLKEQIYSIINSYEKSYTLTIGEDTKRMLYNLIVRMSYDKLCVKPDMK
jgi:hypothetical protein